MPMVKILQIKETILRFCLITCWLSAEPLPSIYQEEICSVLGSVSYLRESSITASALELNSAILLVLI